MPLDPVTISQKQSKEEEEEEEEEDHTLARKPDKPTRQANRGEGHKMNTILAARSH